jgi:hypothetical protein
VRVTAGGRRKAEGAGRGWQGWEQEQEREGWCGGQGGGQRWRAMWKWGQWRPLSSATPKPSPRSPIQVPALSKSPSVPRHVTLC